MSARLTTRRLLATSARAVLRAGARGSDRIRRPPHGVTVLSYHQVGGPRPGSVNLTPARFRAQMATLAPGRAAEDGGRPVVTLDEAVRDLCARETGADAVAITFDDGTADFVDHALPVLVEHGIPATLYLATAWVEEGRSFWDDGTVLSWGALRDALTTGLVTIGTHTHTHALLDRAAAPEAARELDTSIGLVQDHLGVTPQHFAYPKAVAPAPGSATAAAVRERVRSAAVAGGRVNAYGATDPWRLSRTPVVAADDDAAFRAKAAGGLRLEGEVRELVDRVRYRRAER